MLKKNAWCLSFKLRKVGKLYLCKFMLFHLPFHKITKKAPPFGGAPWLRNERVPFAKCKLYDSIANIKYLSEIHKKVTRGISCFSCSVVYSPLPVGCPLQLVWLPPGRLRYKSLWRQAGGHRWRGQNNRQWQSL